MTFQRNVWYVAARPEDVDRELRRRVILDEPVLLYRTEKGEVVAMRDRCPHRFAPLSRGGLSGDTVQCKYHGLRFDSSGHCILNPHGGAISANFHVHRYPTAERHGLVWMWTGDPASADAARIPELTHMDAPGNRTVHSYLKADYRYDILVDNLLDLSHAEYLHVGSFTSGTSTDSTTQVSEKADEVFVVRTMRDSPAPPFCAYLGDRVDQTVTIHWRPGQVMDFELISTPAGDPAAQGQTVRFSHIATPETRETTHYFMSVTRDFALDDPNVDAEVARGQVTVIQNEDGPMLEAVDEQMHGDDLLSLRPLVLPVDVGAMRVRRIMKRLISEETARVD